MKLGRSTDIAEASFDLTPMIDIVLLLLVFFTMTAQFAATAQRPVNLPAESGEAGDVTATHVITVDIDRDGQLSILGSNVTLQRLVEMISATANATGDPSPAAPAAPGSRVRRRDVDIIVRADRDAAAGHLNQLARALSDAGVRRWKLATSPARGSTGSAP